MLCEELSVDRLHLTYSEPADDLHPGLTARGILQFLQPVATVMYSYTLQGWFL